MEELSIVSKLIGAVKKYRFALLILLIGIVLITFPVSREVQSEEQQLINQEISEDETARLEQILGYIHGAGKLKLYLSVSSGEKINYQTDDDIVTGADSSDVHRDTVIISGSDRSQSGLITQIDPPKYLGAVIVCQGADSATVRLAIVDAVSKATGLGSDKITVLKMK